MTAFLHSGPALEFCDPLRQSLLSDLETVAKDDGRSDFTLPPDVWSALWLSDIERLEELKKLGPVILRALLSTQSLEHEVLKPWNQRKRLQSMTSSLSSSQKISPRHSINAWQSGVSPVRDEEVADAIECLGSIPTSHPRPKRSALQKNLCKSRDNSRCVVTQMPEVVEIAHIYPYSMSSLPDHGAFWDLLGLFWSDHRIQQWKAAVFTENRTEVCHNLITLAPHVHACWERALFVLKPLDVAEDQKAMRVQFFWLRKYPRRQHQFITTRPELPANLDGDMTNIKLFSCETKEKFIRVLS
ncbi:hypothetical protein GX51_05721 [Blastomyces parvus]|uniref:HNH nuclease domain-containing protein n=1 Tax=Blastomyces parvus TaxID=2060905 RepID=A0A2B7WVU6_9EURO|nr:hypothetical protein GX51_05721 [Blastomyces parvus]